MGQLLYHKKYAKAEKVPAKKFVQGSFRKFERIVKGFANHRRIEILFLLKKTPELSVDTLAEELGANFKTISEHVQKLAVAGLIMKRNDGKFVRHKLTDRGNNVLSFLRMLE